MNCKETLQVAFLYLDNELLSEEQRIEITRHLEECRPCLECYGLNRELSIALARLKGSTACPERLRMRIIKLFDESSGESATL
jgi:mycothiol system anti-sigma-R factor